MKTIRTLTAALALTGAALTASADTPFNGLITDADGNGIKKARVYVADPRRYATTDRDGRFGLTDVAPDDTIHIRIKKQTYAIAVDGRKSLKIKIIDPAQLTAAESDELVDMGYGYVKRREYTGSSNGITGERLRQTGCSDILDALKGLVPGLNIGPGGRVTLRGTTSLTGPSEPLFIVNTTVVNSFAGVNINDVESVEVLKDGTIYGSRGANGAIIVHTKRK